MVLTPKQRQELHASIAEYLSQNDFTEACAAFVEKAGIEVKPSAPGGSLLEKKWTSVVRLQKRVMDLEAHVKQLEEELKNAVPGAARRKNDGSKQLPRPPHKHNLAGHRNPISKVVFHPVSCPPLSKVPVRDEQRIGSFYAVRCAFVMRAGQCPESEPHSAGCRHFPSSPPAQKTRQSRCGTMSRASLNEQ
jgi:hypothetical protein